MFLRLARTLNKEFEEPIKYLGGKVNAAFKLKSEGDFWESNIGNYSTGFNAEPVSYVSEDGWFGDAEANAVFWSSTLSRTGKLYCFWLSSSNNIAELREFALGFGANIRFIKNK